MVFEKNSTTKAETFSLSFDPTDERPARSEDPKIGSVQSTQLASENYTKNRGSMSQLADDPMGMCPLLPAVKRNINNKLAMFLEGKDKDRHLIQ